MTERQVPDAMTHALPTDVYIALRAAWRAVVGTEPARASLLVLLAHWHLETAGGNAMHCWNLGNIKHVPGDGRDYCIFRAGETIEGKNVEWDMAFRAYPSLAEGVGDYMREIRGQFGFAWPAVESGDPADFAHRLKTRGYYTAPETTYTAVMRQRYELLDAHIPPDTEPELPPIAPVDRTATLNEEAELVGKEPPEPPEAA